MRVATAEQMRELDRVTIEERGVPSTVLMERAAQGIADAVRSLTGKEQGRCAVFCGPGNNGGDGVAAGRLLREAGWEVSVFLVGDPDRMTADTAEMARRLAGNGEGLCPFPEDLDDASELLRWCSCCDAFVDALFGIGLGREVSGVYRLAIEVMNRFEDIPTVSADIPSGVETDTGRVLGAAVNAAATVTFTLPKIGHYVGRGGVCTGKLLVHSIGIPMELTEGLDCPITAVDAELVRSFLPRRDPCAHKGDFGRVHILGGSVGYTGAPVLAARGALRSGAGLVSLSVPASIYPIVAGKCDEAMPAPLPVRGDGSLAEESLMTVFQALVGKDACLIGPGLGRGPGQEALVSQIMTTVRYPLVVDADGLNAISAHIDRLDIRRDCPTILTPHDGEFVRLGGDLSHGDRVRAALEFAADHGCVVVLKGHGTIVALPNGRAFLNTTGNCGMAKGGSGDVLGGMILSLIGQGIHPVKAAVAAVWLHGRAGDLAAADKGTYGMTPSDLVEQIPYALKEVTQS